MSETMTILLSCPSCEAELEIAPHHLEDVACLVCGSQQLIQLVGAPGWLAVPEETEVEELERVERAKRRRREEIALQKLRGEILHAHREMLSWQQTPLDEICPPHFAEKALPFAAGATVIFGFFSANRRSNTVTPALCAGSLLLGLYLWVRGQRRTQAQTRVKNIVGRWLAEMQERL